MHWNIRVPPMLCLEEKVQVGRTKMVKANAGVPPGVKWRHTKTLICIFWCKWETLTRTLWIHNWSWKNVFQSLTSRKHETILACRSNTFAPRHRTMRPAFKKTKQSGNEKSQKSRFIERSIVVGFLRHFKWYLSMFSTNVNASSTSTFDSIDR